MWWKLYYWFLAGLTILGFFTFVYDVFTGGENLLLWVIYLIALIIQVYGLHCYLNNKKSGSPSFWKWFFWISVIDTAAYFIYTLAPDVPYIRNLSFLSLSGTANDPIWVDCLYLLVGLPILYALYQISKGKYQKSKSKK